MYKIKYVRVLTFGLFKTDFYEIKLPFQTVVPDTGLTHSGLT